MFQNVQYIDSLEKVLNTVDENEKYLLLVAQESDFDIEKIPDSLHVAGAIFPRLIKLVRYLKIE